MTVAKEKEILKVQHGTICETVFLVVINDIYNVMVLVKLPFGVSKWHISLHLKKKDSSPSCTNVN